MRALLEILVFALGLAVLLVIGKGLPQFGMLLRHPLVLIALAVTLIWVYIFRSRRSRHRALARKNHN